MQPVLSEPFLKSSQWRRLSPAARGTLKGMLQFVIRRDVEWAVEGTDQQLAKWLGAELDMPPVEIVGGLKELDAAGLVRRGRYSPHRHLVVAAPMDGT